MPKYGFILISMWIAKIRMPRMTLFLSVCLHDKRLLPTEPMSLLYPEGLKQQPSHKGKDIRFYITLKQVSPNIFVWEPN